MSEQKYAALFEHDGDQAVCLPIGYELPGTEVRVSRIGRSIRLEPVDQPAESSTKDIPRPTRDDIRALFTELDRMVEEHGLFMPEGRQQPPMPSADDIPVSTRTSLSHF